jgi:very-short-patch-repair endonuclease
MTPLLSRGGESRGREAFGLDWGGVGQEMKKRLHNVKALEENRRELRSSMTPAEATLWRCLQRSQLAGKKFRRQHSIEAYIVDFYCLECRLAIELDGAAHFTDSGAQYDAVRTELLTSKGIRVLRFENQEIFDNLDLVLEEIQQHLIS